MKDIKIMVLYLFLTLIISSTYLITGKILIELTEQHRFFEMIGILSLFITQSILLINYLLTKEE
jgi:hypothetical protein